LSSPEQDIKPENQAPAVYGETSFSVVNRQDYNTPAKKHPERRAQTPFSEYMRPGSQIRFIL